MCRLLIAAAAAILLARSVAAQVTHHPLESSDGLRAHNVVAEPAVLQGRRGVRVTMSADGRQRYLNMNEDQQAQFDQLVVIEGTDFTTGVIEAEIAGVPAADAGNWARGFVGIAFRVNRDLRTYDAFYLRPTNGRAADQDRRNRATQYISRPAWTWHRLRRETPGRYESYADLVPNQWTKIRIEVSGDTARLFLHGGEQPVLVVNDVKSGRQGRGSVALWIDLGTVAHFRNLVITPLGRQSNVGHRAAPSDDPRTRPVTHSATVNGRRMESRHEDRFVSRRAGETLPQQLEACWRAEEPNTNRDTNLDQYGSLFHADVRTRWCRATLEASGVLERRAGSDVFTRVDGLTLRFLTDTLELTLQERRGEPTRLMVNGRVMTPDWWTGGSRERVIRLARLPIQ
jgi:hypothetical protein